MMMQTTGNIDYKLSRAELLYLGAAADAKVLYGLPGGLPMSDEEMKTQWEEVRGSLIAKGFADEKDGLLEVRQELSELVRVMAGPLMFMVSTSRVNGRDTARNFYCRDGRVIRLSPVENVGEQYYLTEFQTPERLSFELQTFLTPPHEQYRTDTRQLHLSAAQFQAFIDAIALGEEEALQELVTDDFPEAVMRDLKNALTERRNLGTVVTVLIDKEGENRAGDFLLITAAESLWQIEVHAEKAKIRSVSIEDFIRKTDVLSELCFHY